MNSFKGIAAILVLVLGSFLLGGFKLSQAFNLRLQERDFRIQEIEGEVIRSRAEFNAELFRVNLELSQVIKKNKEDSVRFEKSRRALNWKIYQMNQKHEALFDSLSLIGELPEF